MGVIPRCSRDRRRWTDLGSSEKLHALGDAFFPFFFFFFLSLGGILVVGQKGGGWEGGEPQRLGAGEG